MAELHVPSVTARSAARPTDVGGVDQRQLFRPGERLDRSPEDRAYRSELRQGLAEALDGLPEVDRTIVWLKDALGMSHQEIAAATESTVLAVRSRLHRAHLVLRTRLARRFGAASCSIWE